MDIEEIAESCLLEVSGHASKLQSKRPKGRWHVAEFHGARPADTWPNGSAKAIGLDYELGETGIAKALALKFTATFAQCKDVSEVEHVAEMLEAQIGKHPFVHRTVVLAVTRRCCEFLSLGWADANTALEDMFSIFRLRKDNLLAMWRSTKQALTDGLCAMCCYRKEDADPGMLTTAWVEHTVVFAYFAEAGFVSRSDAPTVEKAINDELHRNLAGLPLITIQRLAPYFRGGGANILRARAAADCNLDLTPPDEIKPRPVLGDLVPEVPTSVSAVAFESLRAAERAGGKASGKLTMKSSDMLSCVGLEDPSTVRSLAGRRASFEGLLSLPGRTHEEITSPTSSPVSPKPRRRAGLLNHADVLRRAGDVQTVRHVGPSHMRVEVPSGIGAAGHARVGGSDGDFLSNVAPVKAPGMTVLQRSLFRTKSATGNFTLPPKTVLRKANLIATGTHQAVLPKRELYGTT